MKKILFATLLSLSMGLLSSCDKEEPIDGRYPVMGYHQVIGLRFIDSEGNNLLENDTTSLDSVSAFLEFLTGKGKVRKVPENLKIWKATAPGEVNNPRLFVAWTTVIYYTSGKDVQGEETLALTFPKIYGDTVAREYRIDHSYSIKELKSTPVKVTTPIPLRAIPFENKLDSLPELFDESLKSYKWNGYVAFDVVVK